MSDWDAPMIDLENLRRILSSVPSRLLKDKAASMSTHVNHPFVVHHIGARGETQAFPKLPAFEPDIVNVLYEADISCLDEVQALNSERTARIITVPRCISGRTGRREFYEAHHAYGNSLLQADPEMGELCVRADWINYDYTTFEALSTKSVVDMDTMTLDDVIADYRGVIPTPDFLSLDTQGSELEILQGSPSALASTVCVVTEVEFTPLYRDQPLFGEICRFLHDAGFVFCRFFKILGGSPFRAPLGLRGQEVPVTTDALFLRRPDRIAASEPTARHLMLRKLAFAAIVYGFFDHAWWALTKDTTRRHLPGEKAQWYQFTQQVGDLAESIPHLMPDGFAEYHSRPDSETAKRALADRLSTHATELWDRLTILTNLLSVHGLGEHAENLQANLAITFRQAGLTFPPSTKF